MIDMDLHLPEDQVKRVFSQDRCEIDNEFMGFIEIYKHLAEIIPRHFTVVDLGCGYNPQCFYFTEHKLYMAVDSYVNERFEAPNCVLMTGTIKDFISTRAPALCLEETFAICSYVPCGEADNKLVRETFPNVFVYYPHGGYRPLFKGKK